MDRFDEDRGQPCQAASHDVGKYLVPYHSGRVSPECHFSHRPQAALRERLHGFGNERQPDGLRKLADPLAKPVGYQAQSEAGLPQRTNPLQDARLALLASITLQRTVGVQKQVPQAKTAQSFGREIEDALNSVVGSQEAEHGVGLQIAN